MSADITRKRVRLAGGELGVVHHVVTEDPKTKVKLEKPLIVIVLDERRSNGDKVITAFEDEVEVCS